MAGERTAAFRFGTPKYEDAAAPWVEMEGDGGSASEGADPVRRSRFGTPSHAPDDRIYPGMAEDDPTHEERREEEEVREACERGEHIPRKTAVIVFGDRREVTPIEQMRAAAEVGAFVIQW
jgi:hypothetical protein